MRRSKELIPLSHHHHVALEHALRLRRAGADDAPAVVERFLAFFAAEGEDHLAGEEQVLGPALAGDEERRARLLAEHAAIRRRARALEDWPDQDAAAELGDLITAHVRFEEREAFPALERTLPAEDLERIGRLLSGAAAGDLAARA